MIVSSLHTSTKRHRQKSESCNSETKEPTKTVFELIADRWNDSLFEPETEAFPNLHPDFMFSERMRFDLVADMAQAARQHQQEGRINYSP